MIYEFKGFHGCNSKCDIEVYGNVVVVTEPDENYGTSITNLAEKIATDIINKYKIDRNNLMWFECYPKLHHYSEVTFEYDGSELCNPDWKRVSKEYINNFVSKLQKTT